VTGFLLDILFGVWIGAAIGEELFFSGGKKPVLYSLTLEEE